MSSKGEDKIIQILQREKINFEREKSFKDLKNGSFKFDFYIPDKEICIEFDGAQHFKKVDFFQRQRTDFLLYQENDRRKNSYCLANNIKLYRIPFWEENEINSFSDILKESHLVKNRYHNDNLWRNKK